MAKQKDQHRSGFMIRLPESYRTPLDRLKEKNRRPTTSEVQIALDKHFVAEGVEVPSPAVTEEPEEKPAPKKGRK